MTVLDAFRLAFGPLPEGVTCHINPYYQAKFGITFFPAISWMGDDPDDANSMHQYRFISSPSVAWAGWIDYSKEFDSFSPDISGRPASAFRGFFGPEYDAVLDGVKG